MSAWSLRRNARPMISRWSLYAFITGLLLTAAPSRAAATFFGPKTYTLAAGQHLKTQETIVVSAPCDSPRAVYTIVLTSGKADGTLRVKDAQLTLNGHDLFSNNEVRKAVGPLEIVVGLQPSNTLTLDVEADQQGGAVLTVAFQRHVDLTAPVLNTRTYPLSTSKTVTFTESFAAANLSDPFTLVFTTGDAKGKAQLEQVSIMLNGKEVLTKKDLDDKVSGGGAVDSPLAVTKTVTLLAQNSVTLELKGNASTSTLTVLRHLPDAAGPALTFTNFTDGQSVASTPLTLTGTITDPSGVVALSIAGRTITVGSTGAFTTDIPLTPGRNAIAVDAMDCEGNARHQDLTVQYDVAPVLSITTPAANAALKSATVVVAGTATSGPGIASVSVNGTPATLTGTTWTASVTFQPVNGVLDGPRQITATAIDRAGRQTSVSTPIVVDTTPPAITATLDPPPNAAGWSDGIVKVTFTCDGTGSAVTACSAPVQLTAEGANQVATGTATDAAGNTFTLRVPVNIDKTPPALTVGSPSDGAALAATSVDIAGTVLDTVSGVDAVSCDGHPATRTGTSFTCRVTLPDGPSSVPVLVSDRAGNETLFVVNVRSDVTRPAIVIASPAEGSTTNVAAVTLSGTVTDDDQVVAVEIGGHAAALTGGSFTGQVALAAGSNTIAVKATDRAGNQATRSLQVTRFALPAIAITSPADLATLREATVTVTGTVNDAASVTVNGIAAAVTNGTFSAFGVPLAQGRTVITATAAAVATSTILVYRDSIPPRVVLRHPLDGMIVYQPSIDVTGMVDDIVVGTINSAQMSVTVNGVAAEVANRAFVARGIALTPGINTIRVTGTDQGGNSATVTAAVKYDDTTQVKMSIVSGNDQTAVIGTMLRDPIVVKVTDHGLPVSGKVVAFEVVENNGTVTGSNGAGRAMTATTNANGTASVQWTLGTRAGAGNNRLTAIAEGIRGTVELSATGRTGTPAQIVVDSGDAQYGAVGARLSRPLVAIVVDAGKNRLAGIPVTFSVLQGGGAFGGAQQTTVNTDSDGRAWATPALGEAATNTFQAAVAGVANSAGFQSFGKVAGAAEQTAISGVILDNTDLAVAGVSVRVEGTTLVAQANDQGQFTIAHAPVGYVKLIVDGSTSRRPGTWPTLEYAMYTISGADNTLEMPIHILPLDVRRGLFVDETTGGTLTLPELPGFALTIKPGSATFPGGSRTGIVSVTMVHADKVPMSPGFGQQPRFIVTIQPPGVHFDPPAPLTFPNVESLAPGAVTEMYSFDHDLGQFVSIGTASVSADGLQIGSDPGVGIIKGGWHCASDPSAQGTAADCPTCKLCDNKICVDYSGHEKRSSDPDANCCSGAFFNLKSNCCGGPPPIHLVGKRFSGFTDCPGWVPDHQFPANKTPPIFDYNGCSIPGFVTSNPNNPAFGQYTAFSGVAKYGPFNGPQNGNYQLPCDAHDECYQRCQPNAKGGCDETIYENILSVCNFANLSGEDSTTVANCIKWASKVREGLRLGGLPAFEGNQKKACLCCADSGNPN
jgi:hypothetical protein